METLVKKYQQKFRKVQDEMDRWDQLQSRFLSQFGNASSIIESLEVFQNTKNYGVLKTIPGIKDELLGKQMMSLEAIFCSITETMKEFHGIVLSLEKIYRDGKQQVKGGAQALPEKQLKLRIGIRPSVADCLEGLRLIHEMHRDEYNLKLSTASELMSHKRPRASDLAIVQQLLVDQPNIPKEEVTSIFNIIFAEEIC